MDTPRLQANLAGDRSEIGGYEILRTLLPDQSWLASAPGGRLMVLKTLDEDCLWKGQLHPNVKDRLGRVRELAHSGVANLYGVERDSGLAYLVWEYVAGETLEERAGSKGCGQRDLMVLARELVLAVEMLHARGIVHGALKASNVVVDPEGRVILTHVSPLLYTEPGEDVSQVVGLLWGLVERRAEVDSPLGRLLEEVEGEDVSLRRLAGRLGALIEARESGLMTVGGEESDQIEAKAVRRRALLGAGATALLGMMLFFGLRQYANARTPKAPVPPQASPAALQPASATSGGHASGERPSAAVVGGMSRRVGS
jgi:hypothetical protein